MVAAALCMWAWLYTRGCPVCGCGGPRIWAWSPTAMENGEHDETIKTLQAPTFGEVMAEYEVSLLCGKEMQLFSSFTFAGQKRKGKKSGQAEEYLHENEGAVTAVREAMSNQTQEVQMGA